jgi:hypothetical protein
MNAALRARLQTDSAFHSFIAVSSQEKLTIRGKHLLTVQPRVSTLRMTSDDGGASQVEAYPLTELKDTSAAYPVIEGQRDPLKGRFGPRSWQISISKRH